MSWAHADARSNPETTFVVDGRHRTASELRAIFAPGTHDLFTTQPRFRAAGELVERVCTEGLVVDIGSYAGSFIEMLNKRLPSLQYVGIDSDDENIRIARELYPERADAFVPGSAYRIPFADETVDCATFLEVLEHIDRPVDAVRELNRVLRVGGHLVLSTPNGVSLAHVLRSIGRGYKNIASRRSGRRHSMGTTVFSPEPWNRHLIEFSHGSLHNVLALNGFELVEHRFIPAGRRWSVVDRTVPGLASGQIVLVQKTGSAPASVI